MRISRVYIEQAISEGSDISLDAETAHYLTKVLRLKPGHVLNIFNELSGEYRASLIAGSKKQSLLRAEELIREAQTEKVKIHLGLGLSRGERMDYAVQKATELGVASITPLFTEHSEVKLDNNRAAKKGQHWQKIAVNAAQQCGRLSVPPVRPVVAFSTWLESEEADLRIMFDAEGKSLRTLIEERQVKLNKSSTEPGIRSVVFGIGPEGGFSADETNLAIVSDFFISSLGPRVLRTETAPVVALSLLQYLVGDFEV